MAELDGNDFNLLLLCEPAAQNVKNCSQHVGATNGGGSTHAGVGICVRRKLAPDIANASFYCYSERVCALHFSVDRVKYRVFACYFPTTWAPGRGRFLWLLFCLVFFSWLFFSRKKVLYHQLQKSWRDIHHWRRFQCKYWNTTSGGSFHFICSQLDWQPEWQGVMLMQWTVQNGLLIHSKWDNTLAQDEACICCRAMDLSLVQLDCILNSRIFSVDRNFLVWWYIPLVSIIVVFIINRNCCRPNRKNKRKSWVSKIENNVCRIVDREFDHCLRQSVRKHVGFFFLRSFWAAEGPLTKCCCTGQPPSTDCFYFGQSPDVLVVRKV